MPIRVCSYNIHPPAGTNGTKGDCVFFFSASAQGFSSTTTGLKVVRPDLMSSLSLCVTERLINNNDVFYNNYNVLLQFIILS